MYSLHDKKAEEYGRPFYHVNDQDAKRSVAMALESTPVLEKSPEDFDLYCVGEFDEKTGNIRALSEHVAWLPKVLAEAEAATIKRKTIANDLRKKAGVPVPEVAQ